MASSAAKQERLQYSIERALTNFKKIGKANVTTATVRNRIASVKETWRQYQAGDLHLAETTSPEEKTKLDYFKLEQFEKTEEVYLTTLDYLEAALEELERTVSQTTHTQPPGNAERRGPLAQLPPIQLPPFDGQLDEWESFRDRFTALIIQNSEVNGFARMHYLMSCLKGRARECVANLPVTAENFEIAWKALTKRFENRRRLLTAQLGSLLNLPVLSRESSADLQSLRDRVSITVASLKNLGRSEAELWNDTLVYIVSLKLDPPTRKAWSVKTSDDDDFPSFSALQAFIDSRVRALESLSPRPLVSTQTKTDSPTRVHLATEAKQSDTTCPLCRARHYLSGCAVFIAKSPLQRSDLVRKFARCYNCLSDKHAITDCPSKYSCRICHKRHHTLVHRDTGITASNTTSVEDADTQNRNAPPNQEISSHLASTKTDRPTAVLLATAMVKVTVSSGRHIIVRALIDQGSEASFISETLVQTLHAKRLRVETAISAVGGTRAGTVRHATQIVVSPRDSSNPSIATTALILKSLTTYVPKPVQLQKEFGHLSQLKLADPHLTDSNPIHIILGADTYSDIILHGVQKGKPGEPIAQLSIFGWIISGPVSTPSDAVKTVASHHCLQTESLEVALKKFWEVEEVPQKSSGLTPEEEECEKHFVENTTRNREGRYVVRLPFKRHPPIDIGASRPIAERILLGLKRRLNANPELAQAYDSFLSEYEALGHMRRVCEPPAIRNAPVYIPHLPVVRKESSTSRIRVVFNASSVTSNGTKLNDHLLTGPKLQTDLAVILLRWRRYRFVYVADIAKMYRQILVDPRDVDFQRILWSKPKSSVPEEYQLLTVTYGMNCAPFLALRVLKQLSDDEGPKFPLAVSVLRENTYVDDVLFGGDDPTSLRNKRDQLIGLLGRGHFTLRKWASNSADLLCDINPEDHGLACSREIAPDDRVSVLGIQWNPSLDAFQIHVSTSDYLPTTKRAILSTIAKLYDPLGWVTPSTIASKIFIQTLWRENLSWDAQIPDPLKTAWSKIYTRLSKLNGLTINRWSGLSSTCAKIELHGFADASTVAYAAAVYIKVEFPNGDTSTSLLAGRSKVAPLSQMSIPRLELAAAVLLSRVMEFVQSSLDLRKTRCICWTDSEVVLAWLRQHPSRWKTFVANRVHAVQSRLPDAEWRHVPTHDNPADCASRGIYGDELRESKLWWQGPSWLRAPDQDWPPISGSIGSEDPPESRILSLHSTTIPAIWELSGKYSSWLTLLRVTAYILRFTHACRFHRRTGSTTNAHPGSGLTASELDQAKTFWIKQIQQTLFFSEIETLTNHKTLSTKSRVLPLNPFLDPNGILRVGGRLHHSVLPFPTKHPILLASHPLVRLIIKHIHERALHAGLQLTLSALKTEFWILRARDLTRGVIHACITCVRQRAAIPEQLMGNLPAPRVTQPSKCFAHCGLDYAGPVHVRVSSGRGIKSRKAYIALFICLATRAIHLELIIDYSTPAFLNGFSRFCARRGLPENMYSDNGTTFVGADRELTKAYRAALLDPEFQNSTACDGVRWHFIPPSAPHFGGLWEAGVRSVKHHLKRVVGAHTLTYEEFETFLCKIEACLNSRPIAPLTDSLDDYEPLTPGHFLVGAPLIAPPHPSLLNQQENRLSRWQLVRRMTERFWQLWHSDYVNTLQQRSKWRRAQPSIKIGQLVLLRSPTLPPCKWSLARVTQLHPGSDGLTRVVTVKTAAAELRRPINKLCPLPVHSETT